MHLHVNFHAPGTSGSSSAAASSVAAAAIAVPLPPGVATKVAAAFRAAAEAWELAALGGDRGGMNSVAPRSGGCSGTGAGGRVGTAPVSPKAKPMPPRKRPLPAEFDDDSYDIVDAEMPKGEGLGACADAEDADAEDALYNPVAARAVA